MPSFAECSIFGTQSIVSTPSEHGGDVFSADPHEPRIVATALLWDWTAPPWSLYTANILLVSVWPSWTTLGRRFCHASVADVQRPLSGGNGVLFSRTRTRTGVFLYVLGKWLDGFSYFTFSSLEYSTFHGQKLRIQAKWNAFHTFSISKRSLTVCL